ncbi:hypothetical protein VTO73DRAFT_6226 [Trametes versicolor]
MNSPGSTKLNISGIVLHVKEYEGQPPETMSFSKSASRTISVGRKPSQGYIADDPERALFRCPVVSRKHAKITFTEYGNVYITDLHSHHGTHVLRPGELVWTGLKPEVPTVLADGDLITFGKTVGRESYLVRPVVVRVQLVFGRDASPRAPSPLPSSLTHDDSSPDKAPARSSSGRYGVYPPSPDSSPSTSDGDSDAQENSPPASPQDLLPSFERVLSRSQSMSLQSGRLRLLQSLLPPIHVSRHDSPETPPCDVEESFFEPAQVIPLDHEEEDMDLSSSRSASPEENRDDDVTFVMAPEEPPIVGAWPGSSSSSSSSPEQSPEPFGHPEVIEISDDDYGTPCQPLIQGHAVDLTVEEVMQTENDQADADVPEFVVMHNAFFQQVESIAEASARVQELVQPEEREAEMQVDVAAAQTAEILNELTVIRTTRELDEAAFSAHVQQTKERLSALDGQIVETHASLSTREARLTQLQSRLQGLGDQVSDLQERSTVAEREAARIEELMKEVGAAKDTLRETCDLQREARAQMADELEALKALRIEAAAAVAEAKLAAAAVTTAASTANVLKRKREDAEDEAEQSVSNNDDSRIIAALPSKRRRTLQVASTVAHTATVATIGAVAAWAALAFS